MTWNMSILRYIGFLFLVKLCLSWAFAVVCVCWQCALQECTERMDKIGVRTAVTRASRILTGLGMSSMCRWPSASVGCCCFACLSIHHLYLSQYLAQQWQSYGCVCVCRVLWAHHEPAHESIVGWVGDASCAGECFVRHSWSSPARWGKCSV